jgi:hypothetical protein
MHYRLDSVKVAGDSRIEHGLSPTPWWMWPAKKDAHAYADADAGATAAADDTDAAAAYIDPPRSKK